MLFEDMGFYEPKNVKPKEYDFIIDIMGEKNNNLKLYGLEEALEKGNLYPSLYDKYKNYEPKKLIPKDERERKLLEIQELDFSINDLNLYLDIYPNDVYAFKLFQKYVEKCKEKKEEFTNIYGPITLDSITDDYEWVSTKWPWEEGGM